ncbi:putative fluoride ion transporter CrcB [Algimonas arctica]|uniref:Fluoride-specific ion channel FluC n=1 Tax=Algimonas arctica TaxID=1479486 RepID=A0A8J3CQ66_9PROT|nr:fluoride efflux transporter CrcB [Algimonas arctica]GHA94631.1 putative fluoride ion transporter CrcB [Algimonas arctica]
MQAYLLIALGGGIGAMGRHGLGQLTFRVFGPGFPVGTLAANVLGGLLMGLLAGWLATKDGGQNLRLLLGVGLLGGFTTFSAFSLDAFLMFEKGRYGVLAAYVGGSVILAIAAIAVGLLIARKAFA